MKWNNNKLFDNIKAEKFRTILKAINYRMNQIKLYISDFMRQKFTLCHICILLIFVIIITGIITIVATVENEEIRTTAASLVDDARYITHMKADITQLLNSKIELHIVTLVKANQISLLREFAGRLHQYCSLCYLLIYGIYLNDRQRYEILSWKRTRLFDVVDDLLFGEDMRKSLNARQLAIVHALKTYNRVLYVDVNLEFTHSLEKFDSLIDLSGYALVISDENINSDKFLYLDARVQGYRKDVEAYDRIVLTAINKNACSKPKYTCVFNDLIAIPIAESTRTRAVYLSTLPIAPQNINSAALKMFLRSEVNANVDRHNAGVAIKPFHKELELFADSHVAFLRFNLDLVKGEVENARLYLTPLWIADQDEVTIYENHVYVDIAISFDVEWDERHLRWDERPKRVFSTDIVRFAVSLKEGRSSADVTDLVNAAIRTRRSSDLAPKITFCLSTSSYHWIKFHSRYAIKPQNRPKLELVIRNQGPGFLHIQSSKGKSEDLIEAKPLVSKIEP